jgi:hypothetical protein
VGAFRLRTNTLPPHTVHVRALPHLEVKPLLPESPLLFDVPYTIPMQIVAPPVALLCGEIRVLLPEEEHDQITMQSGPDIKNSPAFRRVPSRSIPRGFQRTCLKASLPASQPGQILQILTPLRASGGGRAPRLRDVRLVFEFTGMAAETLQTSRFRSETTIRCACVPLCVCVRACVRVCVHKCLYKCTYV